MRSDGKKIIQFLLSYPGSFMNFRISWAGDLTVLKFFAENYLYENFKKMIQNIDAQS